MHATRLILPILLVVCACSNKESPAVALPDLSAVRANLAFTCTHEADHLPPLDPDADALFKYARYLQKRPGPKDFDHCLRPSCRLGTAAFIGKRNRTLR